MLESAATTKFLAFLAFLLAALRILANLAVALRHGSRAPARRRPAPAATSARRHRRAKR